MCYACLALVQSPARAAVVLVYGDSLSAGYNMDLEKSWPSLLATRWQETHEVINASISGETSRGGLARLPNTLASIKPDLLILQLGANDGLRGSPIAQIHSNLDATIALAKADDIKVVLIGISLPANYGPQYIDAFRQMYRQLAADNEIPLFDLYRTELIEKPGYIQADGLHPTEITQPIIVELLHDFFRQNEVLTELVSSM